jgi:phage shock protein PspC (stress-responsive transcriptional regulator)
MNTQKPFDTTDEILMGVCARLACWADIDPFLVRVNVALAGILLAPAVVTAYVAAGFLMRRRALGC